MVDDLFGFKESSEPAPPSVKGRKGKSKWNKLFEKVREGKTFSFDAESKEEARHLYVCIRTTLRRQNNKDIQVSIRKATVYVSPRKED